MLKYGIMIKAFNWLYKLPREYASQSQPNADKDFFVRCLWLLFQFKLNIIFKTYFCSVFDWGKLNKEIIKELDNAISVKNREGCLLDKRLIDIRVRVQVNFLMSIIERIKPKRILEVGTHNAMFCYVVKIYNNSIAIDTFDILQESQKAVEILNRRYGDVYFHLGDSRKTLSAFSPEYRIDFAWVDGGHTFDECLSDLVNCDRLRIPAIAIDDYKWCSAIQKAVAEFIKNHDYQVKDISNLIDYRGIVYLTDNKV